MLFGEFGLRCQWLDLLRLRLRPALSDQRQDFFFHGRGVDGLFSDLGTGQRADDTSLGHDVHDVGQTDDLGEVGRQHENADAVVGQLA